MRMRRLLGAILLTLFSSAVAIGLLLWWLLRRSPGEREPEAIEILIPPAPPIEKPAEAGPPAVAMAEPSIRTEEETPLPEPDVAPDDLRRIEGIGPKISSVLQAAGIRTFAGLAAVEVSRIQAILEAEDPRLRRLADPTTWPEQARLAAAGDWDGLAALQQQLKGGRRV